MRRIVGLVLGLMVVGGQVGLTALFVASGSWSEVSLMAMVWLWFLRAVSLSGQLTRLKREVPPKGY